MKLPEQELFSLEDVAAQSGKSLSFVEDMARRGILPLTSGGFQIPHFVTRQDLDQFLKTYGGSQGAWKHLKEAAGLYDMSEDTLRRRLKKEDKQVKTGRLKDGDRQFPYRRDGKRILVRIPAELLPR